MDLKQRVEQLKKIQAQLPETLSQIAENATLAAVEKATELTPPTADDLAGTGTRTGEMKAHWATDSKTKPLGGALSGGKEFHTVLANDKQYASYVNDGHRMAKHYVPGLVVNPNSGQLEKVDPSKGGIVVGTKTAYVEGLYMADAAKKVYQEQVKQEAKRLEDLLK